MILMSALTKVSVRITLSVKTIKEVLVATVLTVTKENIARTSMSVTVQSVVTRTPNAQTLMGATPAVVKTGSMETVTGALRADVRTVTALETRNAFQQRPQTVNVKKAFSSTRCLFAKILTLTGKGCENINTSFWNTKFY